MLNELALFSGAGGGILGGLLHGWRTVAAVEVEDYPRRVLLQRQADAFLPRFPIWDDIRTFDGREWKGKIDVITGGFPCQDISTAGSGTGLGGPKSGLWYEMDRAIREVQPQYVFIENSEMLLWRGVEHILNSLDSQGFGGALTVLPALSFSEAHIRNRVFILADATCRGWKWLGCAWTRAPKVEFNRLGEAPFWSRTRASGINGTGYGLSNRVDRLKAVGNAQFPAVAAFAWEELRCVT